MAALFHTSPLQSSSAPPVALTGPPCAASPSWTRGTSPPVSPVAETDDEVVAALSVDTGERVADPFRRTADVVDLLAYRARGLRTS